MTIIRRYLIKTIIQSIVLVLLLLAGLNFFFLFVDELHDIGTGNYDLTNAIFHALFELPLMTYHFLPCACLLGSLLGLGLLSSNSELTVMRSAGLSIPRMASIVVLASFSVLVVVTLIGDCSGTT